jgi:gliding motility-associated-like protein
MDISVSFDMIVDVYLGDANNNGGDGMAFVLRAPGSLALQPGGNLPGQDGQYLGFYGIEPSLIVEMDTDQNNGADDPDLIDDHLALLRDGDPDHDSPNCLVQPVPAIPPNANIEDNDWHTLRVKWDADTQEFSVYFDCLLRFTEVVDIVDILQGTEAYYGFTASTFDEENAHQICNVQFLTVEEVALTDDLICAGESVELSVPASLTNVSWSPAAGLNTTTGTTVEASPATTTIYTVTYDGLCGDPESTSVEIEVESLPAGLPDPAFDLCNGAPVTFDPTMLPPGYSATWGAAGDPLPVTVDAPGTYDWNAVTPNGCSFPMTLTVGNETVNAVDLGPDITLCAGQTVTFDASGQNPGMAVLWNGVIPGNTYTASGAALITVEVGTPTCSVTDDVEVFEAAVFNSGLPATATLCQIGTLDLDASDPAWGGGVPTYVWSGGTTDPTLTINTEGAYTVQITADGCPYQTTCVVSPSLNTGVDLGPDVAICGGDQATFTSGYGAAETAWWVDGNPQAVGANFSIAENAVVEVVVTIGNCVSSDEAEVEVIPPFEANLPVSVSFCEADSVWLPATAGADGYAWSTGATGAGTWVSSGGTVEVDITDNGCTFTESTNAIVIPTPLVNLGPDIEACNDEQVTLNTGIPAADWTTWNGVPGTDAFTPTNPGTFEAVVSVNGCEGSDEVVVDFVPVPVFELGPDTAACPGDVVQLFAGPVPPTASVVWNTGLVDPLLLATTDGMYKATATIGNCVHADSVEVVFAGALEADLAYAHDICIGGELQLTAEMPENIFPTYYLWSTGDTTAQVTLDHQGHFEVTLSNLCESLTLPLFLTQVDCDCNIFVPDAFTPDNDGLNDRFKPEIDCVPTEYLFQVFDRWGEVIYQTNSPLAGWIGETHTDLENPGGQGHYNPAGIYHWRVVMMHDANPSGTMQRVSRVGTVTVIR